MFCRSLGFLVIFRFKGWIHDSAVQVYSPLGFVGVYGFNKMSLIFGTICWTLNLFMALDGVCVRACAFVCVEGWVVVLDLILELKE